ncbi:Pyruvate flavodoxin oxidoreductase subunit delta PorD [Helicobacter heilmannii]|uniref:4Fe-4S dicluster domain-containing protein n=1 Tax=Helicobacter heilmannii TaxID=35817 RepID=UPI00244D930D|nr:4Fe-4S dicluster domain-containing protein [Helicobacter heilmannii]GMB94186.1 Pyruvate flavodoxin oxidoreductase subunit delta PorD [Helicobacter heilmannii]
MKNWQEFETGAVLFPFEKQGQEELGKHNNERTYTTDSSFTASVANWRVEKPVHNKDVCINCFNCWVYCPDASILSREGKMSGIDYEHCKGCGVCVDVCPTNPKSLLMFDNLEPVEEALTKWPEKKEGLKKKSYRTEGGYNGF